MKVLLAGGAGFLGSHLVEKFLIKDYAVHILDNFNSGLLDNLKSVQDRVKIIKEDVIDFTTDEKYDLVINFASRASRVEWETHPVDVALSNAIGSRNLIEIALKSDAMYVFASSSEIYGDAEIVPTPEDYLGRVSTTGSRSSYDEGKRFGDALTKAYEKQYGLKNIILRFFNTYGPRMRGGDFYGRVVDRFIEQALKGDPLTVYGDGKQTRSFTYVDDTINGVQIAIEKGKPGEVYNIGNDMQTNIIDLAHIVQKVSKSKSQIHFKPLPENDPKKRAADITKMRNIGWYPQISLEDGIERMIQSKLEK